MNGPEHYREAERLLAYIEDGALQEGVVLPTDAETSIAIRAQAHATLALAAATAMAQMPTNPGEPLGMHLKDFEPWDDVAGVEP